MNSILLRETENAELRWRFVKQYIEPHIKEASNDATAKGLLPNHEFLIRRPDPAILVVKCRKTAHSWGIALKALARAVTEEKSTTIIGSYDEDEAKEKLNFLDWQYRALIDHYPAFADYLGMSDGSEVRRFKNGSRIKFISRKEPTGAGASIEWDEFSVEKQGRVSAAEILTAALGCTTHTGSVSLGGTQRGPDTVFNQIITGKLGTTEGNPILEGLPKVAWKIGQFPWWVSPALCKDVRRAIAMAPNMETHQRVLEFGNDKLQQQYGLYVSTVGEELFQREFEMKVLDDKESYFPYDLITRCYDQDGENYFFQQCDVDGGKYDLFGDCFEEAKLKIDALANQIRNKRLTGEWGWTMDIGRDNDQDEIWIGRSLTNDRDMLLPHLNIGMNKMPFPGKQEIVNYIFASIPISRGLVDGTKGSIGRQFSEWAERKWGQRATAFIFTQDSKTIIASGLKARMQVNKIVLPRKRPKFTKLENQLLLVKKTVSATGAVFFDVERNKNHHGDCFWGLCMLSEVFSQPRLWSPARPAVGQRRQAVSRETVRPLGSRTLVSRSRSIVPLSRRG